MAKAFTTKLECLNSNRSKTGASVVFSTPQPEGAQKPGAQQQPNNRTVVAVQLPDADAALNFTPGKTYNVKIEESA